MSNQLPTFMIINQAKDGEYCLAIRGRKVVVNYVSNPEDPYQRWMKKVSATKDQEGQQAFFLVNVATNEAIKHDTPSGPVKLIPYDQVANSQDISLLWTVPKADSNLEFKRLSKASNNSNSMCPNNHVVRDVQRVDISTANGTEDRWKFVPDSTEQPMQRMITISCQSKQNYNLTIRGDTVLLAPADPKDEYQKWIKDISYAKQLKDREGQEAYALINKATGQAIKHGFGPGYLVQLSRFDKSYLDSSLLWTESEIDKEPGFREIRMQSNNSAVFNAFYVNEQDSDRALLALQSRNGRNDQRWTFKEIN